MSKAAALLGPCCRRIRVTARHYESRSLQVATCDCRNMLLTCPHFPHGDLTTYPAAVEAVGKLETPGAFSKWAQPTSFP